jgi:hypothetical protein
MLKAQGIVLRLAGLYSLEQGAHAAWLKNGVCEGLIDSKIGLVSYEDSAAAIMCALTCERKVDGEVFLVCDGAVSMPRESARDMCAFDPACSTTTVGLLAAEASASAS